MIVSSGKGHLVGCVVSSVRCMPLISTGSVEMFINSIQSGARKRPAKGSVDAERVRVSRARLLSDTNSVITRERSSSDSPANSLRHSKGSKRVVRVERLCAENMAEFFKVLPAKD